VLLTRPAVLIASAAALALALAGCSSAHDEAASSSTPAAASSPASSPTSTPVPIAAVPQTTARTSVRPTPTKPKPTPTPALTTSKPAPPPAPPAPKTIAIAPPTLPLSYSTGTATQLITVTASSASSTHATVQAWSKSGASWVPYGPSIAGHVGSQGLTAHPSESLSATPVGSFTLTQAFGALSNPGTPLPYFKTTLADWWISQTTGAGASLYNTHQHCSGSCPFTQGAPNEHLVTETPFYNYAVVIDYHGGLGDGSAFFLHVTDGNPTAGCVSIPQANLVTIMQWLRPADHPRILIGVG
jgi:L,D-peptidoglycan transpeptidase YkuD (ErfK/YbiS/YcfS/YnhG family)